MARRRSTYVTALVVGAFTLSACAPTGDGESAEGIDPEADLSEQSIVVANWANYMPEDIDQVFNEATGATMETVFSVSNEELIAKVQASRGEIDVIFASQPILDALASEGLLEPLDTTYIENWGNLAPQAADIASASGEAMWAPYAWGTTGICYREDLVDSAPTSWWDLLTPEPQYEGKITMLSDLRWAILPAQKVLGLSVNETDEAKMSEVQPLLEAAKDTLLAYDDSTFFDRLISGEAVMTQAWDGWCNYGTAANPDIKFVVPDEGSDLWIDAMAVLKTSENKEAAMKFIDTILDGETHAWVADNILYNVPNDVAQDFIDPATREAFDILGTRQAEMLQGENMKDIGPDAEQIYIDIWTRVTAS